MDDCTKAQNVIRKIAGLESAIVVSTYHEFLGPSVEATLENGDVWTIQPGIQYDLTVISPSCELFSFTFGEE